MVKLAIEIRLSEISILKAEWLNKISHSNYDFKNKSFMLLTHFIIRKIREINYPLLLCDPV
jgi:hypothetical protein